MNSVATQAMQVSTRAWMLLTLSITPQLQSGQEIQIGLATMC